MSTKEFGKLFDGYLVAFRDARCNYESLRDQYCAAGDVVSDFETFDSLERKFLDAEKQYCFYAELLSGFIADNSSHFDIA